MKKTTLFETLSEREEERLINRREMLKTGLAFAAASCIPILGRGFTPAPVGPSAIKVDTAAKLQAALNKGYLDITLTAPIKAPVGGIVMPRLNTTRTLRFTPDAIITRTSETGSIIQAGSGTGGSFILDHVRVDGGWRSRIRVGDPGDSNYYFKDCKYVSFRNCVSCYSLNVAYHCRDCDQVECINGTAFANARGHLFPDNTRDILIEGCLIQHGGDDSLMWHTSLTGLTTNSIIFRNNIIRDSLGGKIHKGVADGMYNGKPSQVLWENNTFEGCGLYGTNCNTPSGDQSGPPKNIIFRGNTVHNLCRTAPGFQVVGQTIGVGLNLEYGGYDFDNTTRVENNKFIRDPSADGKRLQDVFSWAQKNSPAKPPDSLVPGASTFEGFFDNANGFLPNRTIDLASRGVVISGNNQGAIVHSGNTYTGAGWTNQLS